MKNTIKKPQNNLHSFMSRHKIFSGIIIAIGAVVVLAVGLFVLQMAGNARYSLGTLTQESKGGFSTPGAPATETSMDEEEMTSSYRSFDDSNDLVGATERKIIKNGHLSLVVQSTDSAIEDINHTVEEFGGFIADKNIYESGDHKKHGQVTVRIPASFFDEAMSEIKTVAVKVEQETVNTNDVTEEFVDLEARLKALKASEDQLVTLLERAEDVSEVLEVRRELTNIRQQIEQLEGRMRYLSRHVEMSTINVSLVSEADVEVFGVVWSPMKEIKEGVRSMLSSLVDFVNTLIAFVFWLPALILWIVFFCIIGIILWKAGHLAYRRFTRPRG